MVGDLSRNMHGIRQQLSEVYDELYYTCEIMYDFCGIKEKDETIFCPLWAQLGFVQFRVKSHFTHIWYECEVKIQMHVYWQITAT